MFTIEQAKEVIHPVIADYVQKFPTFMQLSIAEFMIDQGATGGETSVATVFNTGPKLYKVSGKLWQSFTKGNVNNIYKVTGSGAKYELTYGSKVRYAKIHEYGGEIKATKKMIGFAYLKKKQTNNSRMWTKIWGSLKWKGKVTIKARPYFNPAIKDFKQNIQKDFERELKQSMVRAIRNLQERTRTNE
jgi:phage gpG-like protein